MEAQVVLARSYRFAAAHHYWNPEWSPEENARAFGKCANRHGHGHNYRIEVRLRGTPDAPTGMLFDLGELDRLVGAAVLQHLDHKHLNHEVAWFASRQPTCENLARFAWEALAPHLPPGLLAAVRVHETEDLWAEVRAGGR